MPPGVTDPIPLTVSVGRLPPGEYRIPFAVTYSYTALAQPNQTARLRTRTETLTATIIVEPEPRLGVSAVPDQSLTPGESRVVRFAVTNTGTDRATAVGLTLSADNGSVYFGTRLDRQSSVGFYIPTLAPGETETVSVRTGADDAAQSGTYLVAGRATYRDASGRVHEARWLPAGIDVSVVGEANAGNATVAGSSTAPEVDSR